jgi:hypothetical protein
MLSTTNILIQTLLNTKTYSTTFEKLSSLEGAKTIVTLIASFLTAVSTGASYVSTTSKSHCGRKQAES